MTAHFNAKNSSLCAGYLATVFVSPLLANAITRCNKVRTKEGSGQGWLVETRVIYCFLDKLKQVRTLRVLGTPTLSVVSAITLCVRSGCLSRHRPCARVSTPSLMNSRSTVAFIRSPRQLLQSDTGVPHFALDPLTYRCLLSLSPAADFAEPRPPSPHTPTARLRPGSPPACSPPPPPHSWRGIRLQSSASPACGPP